jgi:phage I-like protein
MAIRRATLSVELPEGELPSRVRLLRAGVNESVNGDFVFDEEAASAVMAAWETHTAGLDRPGMIDLEHLSLDPDAVNFDPDARAWFDIEIVDGDLWIVDLKWCPDGEARLRERRQRYLSPTLMYDTSTRRARALINVGLTALPALHGAPELMAARKAAGDEQMADNAKAMSDILKALGVDPKMPDKVSQALGLEAGASIDDIRAALDSFAAKMAKVEELLAEPAEAEAAAEEPADTEPAAMAETAEVPVEEEKKPEEMAAARILRITGNGTLVASLSTIESWRKAASEQEAFAKERAAIEASERKDLVGELVSLRAEHVHTAWESNAAGVPDGVTPQKHLRDMPLEVLRKRVASFRGSPAPHLQPPTTTAAGSLSAREIEKCKARGVDPEAYASQRAALRGRGSN